MSVSNLAYTVRLFRSEEELKKKIKKGMPPSSYTTMPHYFPTEQVDIVKKIKPKRRGKKE